MSSGANGPKLNVLQVFKMWEASHKGHELTYGETIKDGETVGMFMCETCDEYKQMWLSPTRKRTIKEKKPQKESTSEAP